MRTLVIAVTVVAALVTKSYAGDCSGPGATCQKSLTGEVLCDCPSGYGCRPWMSTDGSPGNGKCQSNFCLGEGVTCSAFVGVCCPGYTCVADSDGVRVCTLAANPAKFQTCGLGQKCLAKNRSGFLKCTGCPVGSSCRTWIKDNGSYGHGYCQLDACILENEDCTGRKGYCCSSLTCQETAGVSTCVNLGDNGVFNGENNEASAVDLIVE